MIHTHHLHIDGPSGKPILIDFRYRQTRKPKPIIIFCHGYKGYKDWGAWNIMADKFAKAGYYFIKFNFSHNGGTLEQPIDFPDLEAFGQNNYSKELNDLGAVIDWMSELPDIVQEGDLHRIALIGHSRGGAIVTVKGFEDQRINAVVSLAGICSFKARFHEGTDEFRDWQKTGIKYVENARTKQQMPHYFQFYEDFVKHQDRLNVRKAAENLDIPHLIIHGDADTSIFMTEAQNLHSWNPNSQMKIIPGADHVFNTRHPWEKDHLSAELQEVVHIICTFMDENFAKTS